MNTVKKKVNVPGLHPMQLMQLHEEMLLLAAVLGMDATFSIDLKQGLPVNLSFELEVPEHEVGMVEEFQKKFNSLAAIQQTEGYTVN